MHLVIWHLPSKGSIISIAHKTRTHFLLCSPPPLGIPTYITIISGYRATINQCKSPCTGMLPGMVRRKCIVETVVGVDIACFLTLWSISSCLCTSCAVYTTLSLDVSSVPAIVHTSVYIFTSEVLTTSQE